MRTPGTVGRVFVLGPLLGLAALCSACQPRESPVAEPADRTMRIHLYRPDWSSSKLVYRVHANSGEHSELPMTRQEGGWWMATLEANRLEFAFVGDSGRIDLGGTQGCYPNDHYVCDEDNNDAEPFRSSSDEVWVKHGLVFSSPPADDSVEHLTVLTANLHTYQEFKTEGVSESALSNEQAQERVALHGPLFDRIADAINALHPDIVCLQEVGEWPEDVTSDSDSVTFGAADSNMVHQILQRLDHPYFHTMDWSHYGFDVWLEGSAILSKQPFIETGSRLISRPENGRRRFWKSRNIPAARIELPGFGQVAVFSVHTGWWDDEDEPFQEQFGRLRKWADDFAGSASTTLLCGDFNVVAGTRMQQFMTNGSGYSDQYALANPDGLFDPTTGGQIDGWADSTGGRRIDYLLMNDDSPLEVRQSQRVFTEHVFGRVSDHTGVYAQFGRRNRAPEAAAGPAPFQLYLAGSFSGNRAVRGLRFEFVGDSSYRLITALGAALDEPKHGLSPHRLLITDRSGVHLTLGSGQKGGEVVELNHPIGLVRDGAGLYVSLETAGFFQFDLDYDDRTLVISRL